MTGTEKKRAYDQRRYAARREEARAESRTWYVSRGRAIYRLRYAFIRNTLEGKACSHCGGQAGLWHHVDPTTKSFSIACGWNRPIATVERELRKCIPLCRACHMRHHKIQPTNRKLRRLAA